MVHRVARSQTQLSDFPFTFHFHALEKEMATHSSVPGLEKPRDGGAWWAAVCGVTQSQTRLKRLNSSSSSRGNSSSKPELKVNSWSGAVHAPSNKVIKYIKIVSLMMVFVTLSFLLLLLLLLLSRFSRV